VNSDSPERTLRAKMTKRSNRGKKRFRGTVLSDKMDKSITVQVERLVQHPLYKKYLRRKSKFMAHDPHNDAREGDLVEIESMRPLSRRKRWRVVRILRRAPQVEAAGSAATADE